jgi:hypothetical protein
MSGARPLLPLYALMTWKGIKLPSIKHTGYEHCYYETVNTINWTNQSSEQCRRKDDTGQNNLRKQLQLFVSISKQFSSGRIWWWTVINGYYIGHCPNTIFRAKDLLPSTDRLSVPTFFLELGFRFVLTDKSNAGRTAWTPDGSDSFRNPTFKWNLTSVRSPKC